MRAGARSFRGGAYGQVIPLATVAGGGSTSLEGSAVYGGNTLSISGYYTPGDGGGGTFASVDFAAFTGTSPGSGTTLTVASVTGTINVGDTVYVNGANSGITIVSGGTPPTYNTSMALPPYTAVAMTTSSIAAMTNPCLASIPNLVGNGNGGTCVHDSGTPQNNYFLRTDSDLSNFLKWGAHCDNTTDDTAALIAEAAYRDPIAGTAINIALPPKECLINPNSTVRSTFTNVVSGPNTPAIVNIAANGQSVLGSAAGSGAAGSTLGGSVLRLAAAVSGDILFNVASAGCSSSPYAAVATASFTASASGTTLSVSAVTGTLSVGSLLQGNLSGGGSLPQFPAIWIVSQQSGGTGGAGSYTTSSATTLSGSATGYAPSLPNCTPQNGNAFRSFKVDTGNITDGWVINLNAAQQAVVDNVLCAACVGLVAAGNGGNPSTIQNVNINGGGGGTTGLVNNIFAYTTSQTQKAYFYEWGANASTAGLTISNIVTGTGANVTGTSTIPTVLANDVVAFLFDTNANTTKMTHVVMNNPGTCIRAADTFNAQPGPNFIDAFDTQCQTPFDPIGFPGGPFEIGSTNQYAGFGGAGFDLQAGSAFKFVDSFCNHAFGNCVKIGRLASDVEFSNLRHNSAAPQ